MAFSFPLEIEHLDVPFTVMPNVNFPDVTPVCVVTNLGDAPALDRFIVTYTPPLPTTFPEDPDPWQIEFRWQTAGAPRNGIWVLDAWLQSLTQGPNSRAGRPASTTSCSGGIAAGVCPSYWN